LLDVFLTVTPANSINTKDSIYNPHYQNQNMSKNDIPEKNRESFWVWVRVRARLFVVNTKSKRVSVKDATGDGNNERNFFTAC
jgi:hypothetical protein